MGKFSFLSPKKGNNKKKQTETAAAGGTVHQTTGGGATRQASYRPANNSNDVGKRLKPTLFNKKKGPGGLEIDITPASNGGAPASGGGDVHDGVSVITGVTGLPPDSPSRLRNLPNLLPPVDQSRITNNENALYPDNAYSPPSTPSRGTMKISIPQSNNGDDNIRDDVSLMTPVTGVPITPEKKVANKSKQTGLLDPPHILRDDDSGGPLTVFEDDNNEDSINNNFAPLQPRSNKKQQPQEDGVDDDEISFVVGTIKATPKTFKPEKNSSSEQQQHANPFTRAKLIRTNKSWLTSTQYFQKVVDSSFAMIDVDKSGDVTLEELYAGLLLVHLKMAIYVGAPACRPASRKYVKEIFNLLDSDDSGTLDKGEFATVMKILYSQVFTRITIHWMITLMIVPVISKYVIDCSIIVYGMMHDFYVDVDDDLNPIQNLLWNFWFLFLWLTPEGMDRVGAFIYWSLCQIPKGVWRSVPFTVLTLAQTSIALPWALEHVEGFFKEVAHGRDANVWERMSFRKKKLRPSFVGPSFGRKD